MNISLIANTGIQFFSVKVSIDLNDGRNKMYFYEWFDTEEIKLKLNIAHFFSSEEIWVQKKELAKYGYLKNGKPTDDWSVIKNEISQLSEEDNTCFSMSLSKCNLAKFENKWLPFPYFELNKQGDSEFGPINWCRMKMVPTASDSTNKCEYSIILAFDTRAEYDDGNYSDTDRETPLFANEFENKKNYALCNNEFKLVDFCSEKFSCDWVGKYILNLFHNVDNINGLRSPKYSYLASYIYLLHYLQQNCRLPNVELYKDRNVKWIPMDLVVDIGNSKTSAILFEEGDFTKVKPLELHDLSNPILQYSEPFDMRLAFHRAKFGNFGIIDSKQFVYPSFVRLGKEGTSLIYSTINENIGQEKITTFSSPKRFLWDIKRHEVEWEFVQQEGEERESLWIDGISQQFNDDGSINLTGDGGRCNSYSRCSLMTFAFLEILSQARMQINSYRYRDDFGNTTSPRKIGRIIITCPTAMSRVEQTSLRQCAEEAAIVLDRYIENTFNKPIDYREFAAKTKVIPSIKNLINREERIEWAYDEATCSQFVFLYAEISKRYLNNCKEYFNLYGKNTKDMNGKDRRSITIGSIDIGAGTTDLMICAYEYSETGQTTLIPDPLFWESFYYAGDDLLKEIVHQFIIEGQQGAIKNKLIEIGKKDSASQLLFDFYGTNHVPMTSRDRQLRNDFNLQVSIPIALKYLELAQNNTDKKSLTYEEIFTNENQPNETILKHFENHFGFSFKELPWIFSDEKTNQIITTVFEPLLQKIAAIMYAYNCDFILLAGRPTSLKQIENLFLKFYPVTPNRLITLNSYRVGRWYPFQDGNGYFSNQKSIVTIGAMIGNIASTLGGFSGFSLDMHLIKDKLQPTTEYFGLINERTQRVDNAFITPQVNSTSVIVSALPIKIGCRQLDTESYPTRIFYILDIDCEKIEQRIRQQDITDYNLLKEQLESEKVRIRTHLPLTFHIIRPDYSTDKETLIIESVMDKHQDELPVNYFRLQVQSLSESEHFWLDTGEFILDLDIRH